MNESSLSMARAEVERQRARKLDSQYGLSRGMYRRGRAMDRGKRSADGPLNGRWKISEHESAASRRRWKLAHA